MIAIDTNIFVGAIQTFDPTLCTAARRVAVHQVDRILTFDLDDFKRYHQITVLNPHTV